MISGPWTAAAMAEALTGVVVKAMLVDSTYAPSPDHQFRAEVSGEIVGTGYVPGGVVAPNVAVSYDAATSRAAVTGDSVDFGSVDVPEVAGIVFYVDNGSAAVDEILCAHMFEPIIGEGPLLYETDPSGLLYFQVSA